MYDQSNQQNLPLMNQGFDQQMYDELNRQPVQQDIRQSYIPDDGFAADANPLLAKKPSKHIRSLIATFFLFAGQGTIVGLYFGEILQVDVGALAGICAGIYAFYFILALCCNPLLTYFKNVDHGSNFQAAYDQTRSINGHFTFHAQCYHYQTRFHTRTVTDSNGNTRTQTYTTQQKVVTHTATEQVYPKTCVDESGMVDQVRAMTDIIFVHNKVNYRFRDEYSRGAFQSMWYSFQSRHRRDVHQNYSQNFVLPGLKARITFYIGTQPRNYSCYLVLWTFIGMVWPFSMWVEAKISRFDIEYMKVLTM